MLKIKVNISYDYFNEKYIPYISKGRKDTKSTMGEQVQVSPTP